MKALSRKVPGLNKVLIPVAISYCLISSSSILAEEPPTEPVTATPAADAQTSEPPVPETSVLETPAPEAASATAPVIDDTQATTEVSAPLDELQQKLDKANYKDAYALASSLLLEHEGDEKFDFMFAMAALETGQYDEAQFVLERLTLSHPDNPRYQLELARTLYFSGNLKAARQEFNEVLAQNPPAEVQRKINLFLGKIDKADDRLQPGLDFYAELSTGWDSNINSATSDKTGEYLDPLTLEIGNAILGKNSRELGSAFIGGRFSSQYQHPISKHTAVEVKAGLNAKHNSEVSDFDLDIFDLSTGIHQLLGNHKLKADIKFQQFWLGGDTYQSQIGVSGEWRYLTETQWQYWANILAASNSNDVNENLDAEPLVLTLGMHIPAGPLRHNISVYFGSDEEKNIKGKEYGKDYFGGTYRNILYLTPGQQVFGSGSLHQAEYHGPSSITGQTRSDIAVHLLAGWQMQWGQQTLIKTALGYSISDSNIDIYDYQKAKLEVGLGYQF